MRDDLFETYVELVRARVTRPELWRRLPDGWITGARGGRAWLTSAEHVRAGEPQFYARRTQLFSYGGLARLHYAVGDPRLRRASIVFDAIPISEDGAAGAMAASLLNFISHAAADLAGCSAYGSQHITDGGIQIVVDLLPVPEAEPSMAEFFVYND